MCVTARCNCGGERQREKEEEEEEEEERRRRRRRRGERCRFGQSSKKRAIDFFSHSPPRRLFSLSLDLTRIPLTSQRGTGEGEQGGWSFGVAEHQQKKR